jgi:hypothetical protein
VACTRAPASGGAADPGSQARGRGERRLGPKAKKQEQFFENVLK